MDNIRKPIEQSNHSVFGDLMQQLNQNNELQKQMLERQSEANKVILNSEKVSASFKLLENSTKKSMPISIHGKELADKGVVFINHADAKQQEYLFSIREELTNLSRSDKFSERLYEATLNEVIKDCKKMGLTEECVKNLQEMEEVFAEVEGKPGTYLHKSNALNAFIVKEDMNEFNLKAGQIIIEDQNNKLIKMDANEVKEKFVNINGKKLDDHMLEAVKQQEKEEQKIATAEDIIGR